MTDAALPRTATHQAAAPFRLPQGARGVLSAALGLGLLGALWALGGWVIASTPSLAIFSEFAPGPTLSRFWKMVVSGEAWAMAWPSLERVGGGLALAILIGTPMGIVMGRSRWVREIANAPFQFLRMISPLSWMPIAVMAFATWDGAIVFLIFVATVWPVMFATAAGVRRIDPAWLKVARNLGARPLHMLTTVILPAVAQDIFTGIRLALGVAWVVLVPAEYLGVTSGLGYAINDARDTLDYARLGATVLVIGVIGYALDLICLLAIRRLSWLRSDEG